MFLLNYLCTYHSMQLFKYVCEWIHVYVIISGRSKTFKSLDASISFTSIKEIKIAKKISFIKIGKQINKIYFLLKY